MSRNGQRQGYVVAWLFIQPPLTQEKIAFDIPVKITFRRFLSKTLL